MPSRKKDGSNSTMGLHGCTDLAYSCLVCVCLDDNQKGCVKTTEEVKPNKKKKTASQK
jgi:hypothetical protein